jgi:hypothetical protein
MIPLLGAYTLEITNLPLLGLTIAFLLNKSFLDL